MSKSSELTKKVNAYLLAGIDNAGYSDQVLKTKADKLTFLLSTFRSEYGWSIGRLGEQSALKEWLSGLPSSIHIEFANFNILKLAVKWGSLPKNATEKQEDKILGNYWNFMALKLLLLMRKNEAKMMGLAR